MEDQATSQTPPSSPLWTTAPATTGSGQGEWPARVADTIDDVVTGVHDRVIRPLMMVGRGVVFGLIIATMLLVLGVVAAVALVRLLDIYAFGHRVWASDALVGGVLVAAGAVAWWLRRPRRPDGD
jgi:hypothetical protein